MSNRDDLIIVGGGAVGTSIAYFASRMGARVSLIERNEVGHACSFGNAGIVTPSYVLPFANSGTLLKGIKSLLSMNRTFAIRAPLNRRMVQWLLRFLIASRPGRVESAMEILRTLALASQEILETLIRETENTFAYERKGWLHLYRSPHGKKKGQDHARRVSVVGVRSLVLEKTQLTRIEPYVSERVVGGIHYMDDAHLHPYKFVRHLRELAEKEGTIVRENTEVTSLKVKGDKIYAVETNRGDLRGETFVLAAGAWSPKLLARHAVNLPVLPAKGYSMTSSSRAESMPALPLLLAEEDVVVTPMDQELRLTTGIEISGLDESVDPRSLAHIRSTVDVFLPAAQIGEEEGSGWAGMRPLSPDGLPIIGPLERFPNLIVASGHGTLGITLAPITGKLVADYHFGNGSAGCFQDLSPGRFNL